MKNNIIIRMLCLLLCVSLLLPLGAAADELDETSTKGNGFDGLTTNEMAYVNQFYKGRGKRGSAPASYLNDDGLALLRWLSNEKQSGDYRTNSGYLMLDEEVMRRSGKTFVGDGQYEKNSEANWHMFKEFNARFLGPVADYFASGGASVAVAVIEEGAFATKFGWAGKSAYPYYVQLQQVFYEYMTNLQNELQKVDDNIANIAKGTKSIAQIGSNGIRIVTPVDVLFLYGSGEGEGLVYMIKSVDFTKGEMVVTKMGGIKEQTVSLADLGKNVETRNKSISYIMTDLGDEVRDTLVNTLNKNVDLLEDGEKVLSGLPYHFLTDTATDAQGSLKKRINDMDGMKPSEKKIAISENMRKVGDIAQKVGIINSVIQAFDSRQNVTLQQRCYMNVLTNMSQQYLDMLCQWYQDVEMYEVPFGYGDVKEDIQNAILALTKDVLDLQAEASRELQDNVAGNRGFLMGVVYNMGQYAEIILDIAETAGWKKLKAATDLATNISGNDKITAITSGATALFSMTWKFFTAKFLEFEDKACTIYNLKWSLDELLRNKEDGLLAQYAENRTHENACKIIEALNTMKILKLMGENLMEEYYLYDFYDSLGVDISSAAHLVLSNEMAQRSKNDRLNVADSISPIFAVYKSTYPTHYGGASITTEILGLYSNDSGVTYNGVQLQPLPKQYTKSHYYVLTDTEKQNVPPLYTVSSSISTLPTVQSSAWDGWGRKAPTFNSNWLNGENVPIVQNEFYDAHYKLIHYSTYIDRNAKLYASNGVEVYLSTDDYQQYMTLEKEINKLFNKYDDVNDIFWRNWEQQDHSKKEENRIEKEQEYHERLQWTITTRNWIEAIKMYDASIDYNALKKAG